MRRPGVGFAARHVLGDDDPPRSAAIRRDAVGGRGPAEAPAADPAPHPGARSAPADPARRPGTRSDPAELARDARQRGQQALAAGDDATALRWFDRAHRLAPADGTITLALAAACLRRDPPRAETLFQLVAESDDVGSAWLGLAAVRLQRGEAAGAAAALATALRRHVPDPGLLQDGPGLADAIAHAVAAPGWCGITGDGQLVMRLAGSGAVALRLDDKPVTVAALRRGWRQAATLTVQADGRDLLGSPIDLAAISRVAGFVEQQGGGVRGWAWHPGDPDRDPLLYISDAAGTQTLKLVATDDLASVQHGITLARPRGFALDAAALAGLGGPLHVRTGNGADLLGSPLDPSAEQRMAAAAAAATAVALAGRPRRVAAFAAPAIPADIPAPLAAPAAPADTPRRRRVSVVIPVFGEPDAIRACLDSVFAAAAEAHDILVVDDASPQPALRQALDALAAQGRIRLLRHARNLGFPASVNDGIAAAPGHDVVLLNSDTLVPPRWLQRLQDAAYAAPDIGTATPLSNHASIVSYPGPEGSNPRPDMAAVRRLDTAARRANGATVADIPVGVGFCLYLRRDCIDMVGRFRAETFAQGYGEENDFCLRARPLGWRHVAVPGLFVGHLGGTSFGQAGRHLQHRNERLLNRLHPGYDRLIAAFVRDDTLAEPRRRLDLLRWRATAAGAAQSVILVTHDDGGGVERQVLASAASHRAAGRRPIVLRPAPARDDRPPLVVVDGAAAGFPNLNYSLQQELPALLRLLRGTAPALVEVHHTLHHDPAIYELVAALGVPYDVHIHDYPWFCPQVSLVGAERRYCGEPAVAQCEACVADFGPILDEQIAVGALRERSAGFLAGARRVVTPSADAAARMRRHFPALRPEAVPLEDDAALADPPPPRAQDGRCIVCVLGAVGVHKGYDILLACARDAAARDLPLDFVVVGHTTDDARLLATGRVFVTGRFEPAEAIPLIRAQRASLGLLPSVWPETWSFALTELWRAGLQVAAFDFGAPAERIRQTGRGILLPVGLPPRAINHAMIAAAGLTGHEGAGNLDKVLRRPTLPGNRTLPHGTHAKTAG
jgi:GT2 family glycosyltransferase